MYQVLNNCSKLSEDLYIYIKQLERNIKVELDWFSVQMNPMPYLYHGKVRLILQTCKKKEDKTINGYLHSFNIITRFWKHGICSLLKFINIY